MSKALGIINFSGNHIWVKGLQSYRPIMTECGSGKMP